MSNDIIRCAPTVRLDGRHECSFDLTSFGDSPEQWEAICCELGLTFADKIQHGEHGICSFLWATPSGSLRVETYNNPVTGEYCRTRARDPEPGFASYMGVDGEGREVAAFVDAVFQRAAYIKDYSPTRNYA
jgi:hypothetical protein